MSGDRPSPGDVRPADRTTEHKQTGGVPSGQKSLPEKQAVAEGVIAKAKAEDVEDTREETTDKGVRHDLVIPTPPNIPPSIVAERLKLHLNPVTGEPWSAEERQNYLQQQEDERVAHAAAVKESEERMRRDTAVPPAMQPIPHVPTNFLTDRQLEAMQEAQDAGESPVRQAQARDANHPDEIGRREGVRRMEQERRRLQEEEMDEDIERAEVEGEEEEEEEDPEDVERDLNEERHRS